MTLEDPFFVVKDEVFRALKKTRGLYRRWSEFQNEPELITRDEIEWTNTELKNSLRSIEWDLEDLEDTIEIVEKNPTKFKIDNKELTKRKHFITSTKNEIQTIKDKITLNKGRDKEQYARQSLFEKPDSSVITTSTHASTKYSKLQNESESPNREYLKQQHIYEVQNQIFQLENNDSKTLCHHMGIEMDEQQEMLDEDCTELDNRSYKLETKMRNMANIFRISSEKRQYTVMATLVLVLFIVIILFFVL
ncbi:hypothetical protein ABEB36_001800 [Hypothenemus hampei]|uniref:Syntaxin 6/10/61 N-terminal domain-containing protein n=1 Tax=Hypothenemus hampei TaxID=57062 RepID=A0ABD1FFU7_HYPHA